MIVNTNMKYLKRFNESVDELSIDLVKDILLSVYEDEFDFNKFEFFNYVDSRNQNEINFIPNSNVFYFNINIWV